jgi:hypothetical protein
VRMPFDGQWPVTQLDVTPPLSVADHTNQGGRDVEADSDLPVRPIGGPDSQDFGRSQLRHPVLGSPVPPPSLNRILGVLVVSPTAKMRRIDTQLVVPAWTGVQDMKPLRDAPVGQRPRQPVSRPPLTKGTYLPISMISRVPRPEPTLTPLFNLPPESLNGLSLGVLWSCHYTVIPEGTV